MIEGLLIVPVVQISFSKLGVGLNQNKKVFSMNIDQYFANSKLFNSYLDLSIKILAQKEFIKFLVLLNEISADSHVHCFEIDLTVILHVLFIIDHFLFHLIWTHVFLTFHVDFVFVLLLFVGEFLGVIFLNQLV